MSRPSRGVVLGLVLALGLAAGLWLAGLAVVAGWWGSMDDAPRSVVLVGDPLTATPGPPATSTRTATPGPSPTLPPAVDWPTLPDLSARTPITSTQHFAVFAADPEDDLLKGMARAWTPALEDILAFVSARLGRELPKTPVNLVFARAYDAACPARGLASPGEETPLLMIYVTEKTSPVQIRAVLAHEMVHHLTFNEHFVGDGILTEGIAHWGAGEMLLAWQHLGSWDEAVRRYLADGSYVSIADDTALNPRPGDDCIERRDRVYNIRTAFVDWLIRSYGLDLVLAMPFQEIQATDPETGEPRTERRPDYTAATGHSLAELERLWLAAVKNGDQGDA
jgi:hypothetical protein